MTAITHYDSHHTLASTFAIHTSQPTDQKLQKSLQVSHPEKIELKKILPF